MYRRVRLPVLGAQQAKLLRELDIAELLGTELMLVGTNAFGAYELACGVRFPVGNEATEDFDLAWCKGSKISLVVAPDSTGQAQIGPRPTLISVLRSVDHSYRINRKKKYQAINDDGYEVELLAAPSVQRSIAPDEVFEPIPSMIEQEWLLRGQPLRHVLAATDGRASPVFVPDPRWMALHKLWLADKPSRDTSKKGKDRRQGEVLLDAVSYFLCASHPLDVDFTLELPQELLGIFNAWCADRHFVPQDEDNSAEMGGNRMR